MKKKVNVDNRSRVPEGHKNAGQFAPETRGATNIPSPQPDADYDDPSLQVEADLESRSLNAAETASLYAGFKNVMQAKAPQVDALGIQRAAEAADVYYDETFDGVSIGNYTVEASVDGARVYRWSGEGPEAVQHFVATYPDAESAVNSVLDY